MKLTNDNIPKQTKLEKR